MNNTHPQSPSGFMLIELALVILLLALIMGPILQLVAGQRAKDEVSRQSKFRQDILDAVEGFVLAHGRLPCPAGNTAGIESRQSDACMQRDGWLPWASLGVPGIQGKWRVAVATLEQAGEPAQNSMVSTRPFAELSPQQLAEIVLAPYTTNFSVGTGPLPAIHLCQERAGLALPTNTSPGCGDHTLLSPSAVWVAYPDTLAGQTENIHQNRYQQFFINPDQPANNPVWLSFERMNWLWMKRGSLDPVNHPEN